MDAPAEEQPPIDFGDNVRVRATPETEAAGVAGLTGSVYGWTTPSVTGLAEVIGGMTADRAINIHLDGRDGTLWFAPDLLEFVDHGAGAEIRIDGVPKRWVRAASGEWVEHDDPPEAPRRPWWKIW